MLNFKKDRQSLMRLLKGKGDNLADTVIKSDGQATSNVSEMDDVLQAAWDPILRLYKTATDEPTFAQFEEVFGESIKGSKMEVKDITGAEG